MKPGYSAVPDALPLRQALDRCEPLMLLQQRLAQTQARLKVIRPLLPPHLAASVLSGGVDEHEWTVLAANPAVSAKLRQLLPRLEAALQQQGWQPSRIKIRVQSRATW